MAGEQWFDTDPREEPNPQYIVTHESEYATISACQRSQYWIVHDKANNSNAGCWSQASAIDIFDAIHAREAIRERRANHKTQQIKDDSGYGDW